MSETTSVSRYCLICGGPTPCHVHTYHGFLSQFQAILTQEQSPLCPERDIIGRNDCGPVVVSERTMAPPPTPTSRTLVMKGYWLPSRVHSSDVTNTAAWWSQASDPTAYQGQRNCCATPQGLTADQGLCYDMTRDSLGTVMRDEINRPCAQLVELRKCNANQAEQIRHMSAAFTALAGQLIAAEAEDRRLRSLLNRVEDAPADPVQTDIERTIDHLLNGRTTKDQRRGLNTATERAERVKPDSDAAIGRAIG